MHCQLFNLVLLLVISLQLGFFVRLELETVLCANSMKELNSMCKFYEGISQLFHVFVACSSMFMLNFETTPRRIILYLPRFTVNCERTIHNTFFLAHAHTHTRIC